MKIEITKAKKVNGSVIVSGSKSISNRLLIINQLSRDNIELENLSNSDDTKMLQSLLSESKEEYYVGEGGTTARFLIAYLATRAGKSRVIGSDRLNIRPIYPLIDSLRQLGASIIYERNEGCLPVTIDGGNLRGGEIEIDASLSSQFVSALMLIAPTLANGLKINMKGRPASRPYIHLTAELQKEFGIDVDIEENFIVLLEGSYSGKKFTIESDWSSASFFFALASIGEPKSIQLEKFRLPSLQGDSKIKEISTRLGLNTSIVNGVLQCHKAHSGRNINAKRLTEFLQLKDNPDLFPPLAFMLYLSKIDAVYFGLENLIHKESNRIEAISTELAKIGGRIEVLDNCWRIKGMKELSEDLEPKFDSHNDHRIAMACSLSATKLKSLTIDRAEVVSKSNPDYWQQLRSLGFGLSEI